MRNLATIIEQLRPHQWIKNLLIFAAPIGAMDWSGIHSSTLAFISFCFLASGIYVLNDLSDLKYDREHPEKSKRPLASSKISTRTGVVLLAVCLATGLLLASLVNVGFLVVGVTYVLLNALYTAKLKSVFILDILLLMSFFLIRIFAGGVATGIEISSWLITFSAFVFLSFGFLKRYIEVSNLGSGTDTVLGRSYGLASIKTLEILGMLTAVASSFVFVLYIVDEDVRSAYSHPNLLWAVYVLIFSWLGRTWFLAKKGSLSEDLAKFILCDRFSYLYLFAAGATVFCAQSA